MTTEKHERDVEAVQAGGDLVHLIPKSEKAKWLFNAQGVPAGIGCKEELLDGLLSWLMIHGLTLELLDGIKLKQLRLDEQHGYIALIATPHGSIEQGGPAGLTPPLKATLKFDGVIQKFDTEWLPGPSSRAYLVPRSEKAQWVFSSVGAANGFACDRSQTGGAYDWLTFHGLSVQQHPDLPVTALEPGTRCIYRKLVSTPLCSGQSRQYTAPEASFEFEIARPSSGGLDTDSWLRRFKVNSEVKVDPVVSPRKIIQIAACGHENTSSTQANLTLFALMSDGQLFSLSGIDSWQWRSVPLPDLTITP